MRKITFTLIAALFFVISSFGQETYSALKVTGDNVPVIDGTIDAIWDEVEMVAIETVPDNAQITVTDPTADDFSAEFGLLWNEDGLFILFKVVDDVVKIEDDNGTLSCADFDQWWSDDNINMLFSKDLVNDAFSQWEFAWQYNIDQEEKLTSDCWLNPVPAGVDTSWTQSAWYNDGNTYILESFIDWEIFLSFSGTIAANLEIQLEARARDDDDGGSWETMFQWSTDHYGVEGDGVGMGVVTLSATEVELTKGVITIYSDLNLKVFPNPVNNTLNIQYSSELNNIKVSLFDITGQTIEKDYKIGQNSLIMNVNDLSAGIYFIKVETEKGSQTLNFVKY